MEDLGRGCGVISKGSVKVPTQDSIRGPVKGSTTQRLHIDYHCGIGAQKTILIMVLGSLIP